MEEEKKHIELRGEEVQEILRTPPSWLTRWGISLIFVAIACLLLMAGIVSYPELVEAPVSLTSNKPPVPLVTRSSGNLESLLVEDGQSVEVGDLLAVMQNTLNEEDLETVDSLLQMFNNLSIPDTDIEFPLAPELGKLQSFYADFLSSLQDYELFADQNANLATIVFLQQQIQQVSLVNKELRNQKENCSMELNIAMQQLNADRDLYNKGIISLRTLQDSESAYYAKQGDCDEIGVTISNNEVRIQQLNMQIYSLTSGDQQSDLSKLSKVRETTNTLRAEIESWKENYLIMAPVSGKVALNDIWSNSQFLNEGDELLSIVQDGGDIKARALISSSDIGKVLVDQVVNIRFDAYNYMQYGLVKGKVYFVSAVPRDGFYQAEILLDDGLQTTYGESLKFQQGMEGKASIITEKRTILARIFDKFKYLFDKKY